jgi:hypothetical protein
MEIVNSCANGCGKMAMVSSRSGLCKYLVCVSCGKKILSDWYELWSRERDHNSYQSLRGARRVDANV